MSARSIMGVPLHTALTTLCGAKKVGKGISLKAMAAYPGDPWSAPQYLSHLL